MYILIWPVAFLVVGAVVGILRNVENFWSIPNVRKALRDFHEFSPSLWVVFSDVLVSGQEPAPLEREGTEIIARRDQIIYNYPKSSQFMTIEYSS